MKIRTLAATIFLNLAVVGCINYKADYRDFTYPLPNPLRVCLGTLTQSPAENQTLSAQELYNYAEDFYKYAMDFDCPWENPYLVRQQCEEALENLLSIPEHQRPPRFSDLRNKIETLNSAVDQGYCSGK